MYTLEGGTGIQFRGSEIFGKQIAIIGYGRLGEIVGSYFAAMGANVAAYDPQEKEFQPGVKRCESMEEALTDADIVSLHVDYSEETHHLGNRAFFEAMKHLCSFGKYITWRCDR